MEWARKRLGVKSLDDWYQVKSRDFLALGPRYYYSLPNFSHHIAFAFLTYLTIFISGGGGVLAQHDDSLSHALEALYPQHSWTAFKFLKSPQVYPSFFHLLLPLYLS